MIIAFVTHIVIIDTFTNFAIAVEPAAHVAGITLFVITTFIFVTSPIPIHAAFVTVALSPVVLIAVLANVVMMFFAAAGANVIVLALWQGRLFVAFGRFAA